MHLYHFTQITLKIQPVFKLLAKASHNSEEGDCTLPDRHFVSMARFSELYKFSTQNDFPVPLSIANIVWSIENPIWEVKPTQKPRTIKDFSALLKAREIPTLSRFRGSIEGLSKKTGWWWWPLTSYCDVKKRISAVSDLLLFKL